MQSTKTWLGKWQRPRGWKNYSIEFLSVFVAVISAFALNNWNEQRKSRLAEQKILTEIQRGLEKDLEDLRTNVIGHKQGIQAALFFRELLAGQARDTDSLLIHYFNLTRDFVSIQNTSGYETLKSRGLELIRDDSLRSRIIAIYEFDYQVLRKLEEDYYEMQFQANYFHPINDLLAAQLQFNEQRMIEGLHLPLTLSAKDEGRLLLYLWKIQTNRVFVSQYYGEVEAKIIALSEEIKRHLHS